MAYVCYCLHLHGVGIATRKDARAWAAISSVMRTMKLNQGD